MNQELQKQLAAMLGKLVDVSADATKWAGQQIPPLVQEKIVFGRVWETTLFVLLVVGAILLAKGARACYRKCSDDVDDLAGLFGAIGSGMGCAILAVCGCIQLEDVTMVWFAPRLYIVEWLRTLVKG